ncbi:MAG: hypothetical protein AAFN70_15565 [Planctomycetota bacterium]
MPSSPAVGLRFSVRSILIGVTIFGLLLANIYNLTRLNSAQIELERLRGEVGYLGDVGAGQIAAARVPSDTPLEYRFRVSVPSESAYRIAFSGVWLAGEEWPEWFAAGKVPAGESNVVVRIAPDVRDDKWKLSLLIRNGEGTKHTSVTLADSLVQVYRGSHEKITGGIGRGRRMANNGDSLRILDERWLAGEGAMMLYGDRPPPSDLIGVYAELQPDVGPLP